MFKYIKRGKDAKTMIEQDDAERESQRKSGAEYNYRFWVAPNNTKTVTFLDGDLLPDGTLDEICYWEHQLYKGGQYSFYPCIQETGSCPVCESGSRPAIVAVFTIINHTQYKDRAGNTHKNKRELYVCKKDVLSILRSQATKRGGLTGCTYEIGRFGEKSAAAGSQFDFDSKWKSREAFAAKLGIEDATPFNYGELIPSFSDNELRMLGYGAASAAGPSKSVTDSATGNGQPSATPNYASEL